MCSKQNWALMGVQVGTRSALFAPCTSSMQEDLQPVAGVPSSSLCRVTSRDALSCSPLSWLQAWGSAALLRNCSTAQPEWNLSSSLLRSLLWFCYYSMKCQHEPGVSLSSLLILCIINLLHSQMQLKLDWGNNSGQGRTLKNKNTLMKCC